MHLDESPNSIQWNKMSVSSQSGPYKFIVFFTVKIPVIHKLDENEFSTLTFLMPHIDDLSWDNLSLPYYCLVSSLYDLL